MKILFLSMHYRPEPCDTRTSVLARELASRGYICTALTSFPNYPFGKVYDGYRQRLVQKEEVDGVDVVRVPMVPDHSKSIKKRALSYLSFGLSAALLGAFFSRRPDLIWIHHPPLTTGLAGYVLAKLKRAPYVYEIHDLWPETLMSTGMVSPSWITRAIERLCRILERNAAAVIVTSPGMKTHLVERGLDESKIHVIPQWVDEEALTPVSADPSFAQSNGLSDKFNVTFAGNVGTAQGMDTIIDAAELLKEDERIQFVIVGDGVEKSTIQSKVDQKGLTNIRFFDQVAREELPRFFVHSDALLLTLKRDPLFKITVPSKTQTYLFAGKPILCGVEGDTAEVIKRSRAGIVFPPESPESLALAVINIQAMTDRERQQLGESGRACYQNEFSIASSLEVYEEVFAQVTGQGRAEKSRPKLAA